MMPELSFHNTVVAMAAAFLAPLLAVGILVWSAGEVTASRVWCRTDPVVSIDGQLADIFVAAPLRVTGPNRVLVMVPVGVDAELVATDLGFGQGTNVAFAESAALRTTARGFQVRIRVYVPARDAMPVRLEFAHRLGQLLSPATARGTANTWVTLQAVRTPSQL